MKDKLNVHTFNWTEERISRFWNTIYELAPPGSGFAEKTAKPLVKHVKSKINIIGNILDYGTGNGYLINILLENYPDSNISGCDFSEESVNMVNQRFKDNMNFNTCFRVKGFPFPVKEGYFDCIFTLEVIEHLDDDMLISTLSEFKRILNKNGILIITTPNDEDLELKKVICPECGASFHPIQHIQSFDKNKLVKLLSSYGFEYVVCKGINLDYLSRNTLKGLLKSLYYKVTRKYPNLIFIGRSVG